MKPRSVLVLGGSGVLGTAVAAAFERRGWEVRRGVRRADGRPGAHRADLDDPDGLRELLRDADVVVNTVPHRGLTAERAILEHGGLLLNVSGLPDADGRALRAGGDAARGLVVLNAGRTPGVSNLVAADLLAAHPDADTVELAFTLSASGSSGRAGGEFLHRNLSARRRHGTAVIPFPEPLGPRRAIEFAEPERGWLGELAAGRAVRTYVCFVQRPLTRALAALNAVGVLSRLPRGLFTPRGRIEPEAPARDPVREWVAVLRDGRRLEARTIEGDGGYPMAAAATVAFAEALLDDPGRPAGCLDPHEVLSLAAVEPRLADLGVRIVPQPPGAP